MPGGGLTVLAAQSIGLRRAIELSLTGNFLAADIAGNDQRGVRRLLLHYRQLANAATLDEAHLMEGLMAETWLPGTSQVASRRADVMSRGRAQAGRAD